jgi:hypothetical protein
VNGCSVQTRLHLNGLAGTLLSFGSFTIANATTLNVCQAHWRGHLAAGDTIELVAWHNAGVNTPDIDFASSGTFMEIMLVAKD